MSDLLELRLFNDLKNEINSSKNHILSLKDNWDGEGSKGFKEETLNMAIIFLKGLVEQFFNNSGFVLQTPNILPVGDLSIDIHWRTEEMELTINFSEECIDRPSFYGVDKDGNEIQGIMSIEKIYSVILPWLKEFH